MYSVRGHDCSINFTGELPDDVPAELISNTNKQTPWS
jgi:hypothetical protein